MVDTYQKLVSYVDDIKERNNSSASSLVIIKDGSIVLEHYSGFHSNSNAKPITETISTCANRLTSIKRLHKAIIQALYSLKGRKHR